MIGRCNGTAPDGCGLLVLLRFLLAVAAVWFQAREASAEFQLRYTGTSGHLVIFVHGLWGDPLDSFTAEGKSSWLEMMHEDDTSLGGAPALSTYSTATLGYPARSSDRYSLHDIIAKLRGELAMQPELEKHKAIYFVAHSFGGLVVEQLLVYAHLSPGSLLAERTRAAFLIATPSQGAPLADVAARLLGAAAGPLVVNLQLKDTGNFLQGLQEEWRIVREARKEAGKPIVFQCAYELRPTVATTFIVRRENVDPSCNAFPIDANHIQIVKPTKREAQIYQWLRRNLAALNRPPPKDARPLETGEAPKGKRPEAQPPPDAPQATDPPSKEPLKGGKVARSAPQQEGTRSSEKPGAAMGRKDTGAVVAPPVLAPPAISAPAGMPVLRLAVLDRRLDALVRLHWGRLQRKAKLLARGEEDGTATHELNVAGAKRSVAADCGASAGWKLTWTLEFELVPQLGAAASRRGKVTEGVCYGTEDLAELEKNALEAAVRAMIGELQTWSIR